MAQAEAADALKQPVQQMSALLMNAVRAGAEQYAQEVTAVAPNLQLFTGPVRAHGFPTPSGVFFDIEIPSVNVESITLYRQIYQTPGFQGTPTSGSGSNGPGGLMSSPAFLDPPGEYHARVSDALIDAMLQYSALKPGEWLTIAARGLDNSLITSSTSSVLMLEVKQEDLAAYHAGTIDKAQARAKVQVKWF